MLRKIFIGLMMLSALAASPCTSMIVSAKASATGRPLLWKHRDTGTLDNFIERTDRTATTPAYVALYNTGDSLLRDAWMGFNEWGFAIMNTASYNLAPDTAAYKDREGEVMANALRKCRTVDDFERLLTEYPKPMGVQANFGVIDADGNGAYFETDDYKFTKFDLADSPDGVLIRTNYSFTGNDTDGFGYIRYENAKRLTELKRENGIIHPHDLTDGLSRTFYNSLIDHNFTDDESYRMVVDQDFIPRRISTASIVIEGVTPGENPDLTIMWAAIGYPPCSSVQFVNIENVDDSLRPIGPDGHSTACDEVRARWAKAFPITRGSGKSYVDLGYIRSITPELRRKSEAEYKRGYIWRDYKSKNR